MSSIFISLLILLSLLVLPTRAEVIFSTDFEDVPDWTAPRPATGGILFGDTWSAKAGGPTYPPPKKNDGSWLYPNIWFRSSASAWSAPYQQPLATIGENLGHSGRGMKYTVEATGYWSGGSPITLYVGGESGYQELYVSYWAKWDSAWQWPETQPFDYTTQQKLVYISRLNEPLTATSTVDNHLNLETEVLHPSWYPHWYPYLVNDSTHYHRYQNRGLSSNGSAVTYTGDATDLASAHPEYYPAGSPFKFPTDGLWHHYEYHIKMNSAPGVADGVQEVWFDGGSVPWFSKTDRMFVEAGGSVANGFNYVQFFDNCQLSAQTNTTYAIYMDDLAISTERVGALPADTIPPVTAITPTPTTYTSTQTVTLSSEAGATIYYTLDGSTPTTSSAVYSTPLTIFATTTIKYFARDLEGISEIPKSSTYTIQAGVPSTGTKISATVRALLQ